MMSLWDALRMNMMISYQELVRTFLSEILKTSYIKGITKIFILTYKLWEGCDLINCPRITSTF
ncbi:hypothetical protein, partial [Klebsiella grimontii]|uniref:hypothetical protein n=1 Tax=Klebsiella grimontii TaxID=2058152 RepID=UPI002930B262